MHPVTLTLAFYKAPGGISDKLIRLATKSPYSHVEMQTPWGDWVTASRRDGRIVRVKPIQLKPGHWDLVRLPLGAKDCWDRVEPHVGKPYDTLGAILTITPLLASRPGRWFCSELLAYAIGFPQPHTFTPGGLNRSVKSHSLYMSHSQTV